MAPSDAFRGGAPRAAITATGKDAAAFLHRLSTQHVSGLTPHEGRLSVLTTDKGRIVDLVHHLVLGPDRVMLVGHAADSERLIAWLDRYCFTEDVAFAAVAATVAVVDASAAVAVVQSADALGPWAMAGQEPLLAVRTFDAVDGQGVARAQVLLIATDAAGVAAGGALFDVGDAAPASAEAIAAGVPWLELTDAHTPLDLELHDAIHWAKGCYIGQEVIARLDTYGKQRKRLVGVVATDTDTDTDTDADIVVAVGDEVIVADAVVGSVTSAVVGAPLSKTSARALALVKLSDDALPASAQLRRDGSLRPVTLVRRHAAQLPHD